MKNNRRINRNNYNDLEWTYSLRLNNASDVVQRISYDDMHYTYSYRTTLQVIQVNTSHYNG